MLFVNRRAQAIEVEQNLAEFLLFHDSISMVFFKNKLKQGRGGW